MSRVSLLISACLYPVNCCVLNSSKLFICTKILPAVERKCGVGGGGREVKDILKLLFRIIY